MSAKDKFHNQVKEALEKLGWIITHDPCFLKLEGVSFPVDLGLQFPELREMSGYAVA
jgi:hypothetical protein